MRQNKHKGIRIMLLIFTLIAVWAGYQVFKDMDKYQSARNQYEALQDEVTQDADSETSDEIQENNPPKTEADAGKRSGKAPITVDFEALRRKPGGSDVAAWIYIEALDFSYPVLQGTDNDYYLHRSMAGDYEYSGCIFLDAQNSPDFTDPNSIIFGHNMADGSMFGRLKEYSLENAYEKSPYVWILTETGNRCYQIFSTQVVSVMDECYTMFAEAGDVYVEFLYRMRQRSGIDTGKWVFRKEDKIVTLSTCNGDGNATSRYIVQAVQVS